MTKYRNKIYTTFRELSLSLLSLSLYPMAKGDSFPLGPLAEISRYQVTPEQVKGGFICLNFGVYFEGGMSPTETILIRCWTINLR
jgi:hypothetical protein